MCGQPVDIPAQVPVLPVDPVIQHNIEKVRSLVQVQGIPFLLSLISFNDFGFSLYVHLLLRVNE